MEFPADMSLSKPAIHKALLKPVYDRFFSGRLFPLLFPFAFFVSFLCFLL